MFYNVVLMIIPFMLAITVHEVSHGYMAYALGDNTAKNAGRLTLNPIAHIDILGLLCLLITQVFGWAKPVPVNFAIVSRKKYGMLMVAFAGPLSNFLLAVFSVGILYIYVHTDLFSFLNTGGQYALITILQYSIMINVVLGVFNLIPLLPLDGGRILQNLLPREISYKYARMENVWKILIILLLFSDRIFPSLASVNPLRTMVFPLINYMYTILINFVGRF